MKCIKFIPIFSILSILIIFLACIDSDDEGEFDIDKQTMLIQNKMDSFAGIYDASMQWENFLSEHGWYYYTYDLQSIVKNLNNTYVFITADLDDIFIKEGTIFLCFIDYLSLLRGEIYYQLECQKAIADSLLNQREMIGEEFMLIVKLNSVLRIDKYSADFDYDEIEVYAYIDKDLVYFVSGMIVDFLQIK